MAPKIKKGVTLTLTPSRTLEGDQFTGSVKPDSKRVSFRSGRFNGGSFAKAVPENGFPTRDRTQRKLAENESKTTKPDRQGQDFQSSTAAETARGRDPDESGTGTSPRRESRKYKPDEETNPHLRRRPKTSRAPPAYQRRKTLGRRRLTATKMGEIVFTPPM